MTERDCLYAFNKLLSVSSVRLKLKIWQDFELLENLRSKKFFTVNRCIMICRLTLLIEPTVEVVMATEV